MNIAKPLLYRSGHMHVKCMAHRKPYEHDGGQHQPPGTWMRQFSSLAFRKSVRVSLAEEMAVPLKKLRVHAEDHGEELALVMIDLVLGIIPAILTLKTQRQGKEVNSSQIDIHGITLQQQQIELPEEDFPGSGRTEQPVFQQRPGLFSAPVFIQEELIGERGHYVLRFTIDFESESAAAA